MTARNNARLTGLLLAGLTGAGLAAAPAAAESLQEALASAYGNNPTLQSERAKLRATDELVPQALSNWRPTVSVTGNGTRTSLREHIGSRGAITSGGFSGIESLNYNSETVGVSLSQPLYRGGRTVAQTEQAEAQVAAERAQLRITEQTVLLNAATAYLNLVQAQAVLQLKINNHQVLDRQLQATQDRFRVGEVTRTDVAQAQSRVSAAVAERTQAEGGLRTANAAYVQIIGHAPDKVAGPGALPPLPASLSDALSDASANSPTAINARKNHDAALAGVELLEGELLPTVTFTASANRFFNAGSPGILENQGQAVIGVTVPLFQGGQEYARLRAQKQTVGQARSLLDQSERDVVDAVATAWEALQTGRAQRVSYQDQINAAKVALEGVQRESQVGSRTVIEVLNAEQELLTAEVNEAQAVHDEMVAAYQLLNAVGHLDPQTLALNVTLYDPTAHYEEVRDKWVGFGDMPK